MASFPVQQAESRPIVPLCAPVGAVPTAPARKLRSALCAWHLWSLDAPTVALVWAGAFAWAARVHVAGWWWAAMANAVWAVYVADRLLDVRMGREDLQPRHIFHWRWRRVMAPVALLAAAVAAALVLRHLPPRALGRDSMVMAAALAYFSGVHGRPRVPEWVKRLVSRELAVGVVFAAGCALPVISAGKFAYGGAALRGGLALPLMFFAALAWLNVRSITWWEGESRGRVRPLAAALMLAAAGAVAALALAAGRPRGATLMLCGVVSALLLAVLDGRPMDATLRRAAADAVLLTPLALLPLAGWMG